MMCNQPSLIVTLCFDVIYVNMVYKTLQVSIFACCVRLKS